MFCPLCSDSEDLCTSNKYLLGRVTFVHGFQWNLIGKMREKLQSPMQICGDHCEKNMALAYATSEDLPGTLELFVCMKALLLFLQLLLYHQPHRTESNIREKIKWLVETVLSSIAKP